jgi:hypothetical protein
MNVHPLGIRHRRFGRRALSALSATLAAVFLALGCGLLFVPRVAESLAKNGHGPGFRLLLGASHVAAALVLLAPRLSKEGTLGLGLFFLGFAFYWYSADQEYSAGTLALLGFVLLLFGACLRLRRRADASLWIEMLGRYADQDTRLSARS